MRRKDKSIEMYKKLGAEFRLIKRIGGKLWVDSAKVMSSAETDTLMRALQKIDQLCSKAEDRMFHDHPELSNDYLSVFYGNLREGTGREVDDEVIGIAKEVASELFGERH